MTARPIRMARNVLDAVEAERHRCPLQQQTSPQSLELLVAITAAHGGSGYGPAVLTLGPEARELLGALLERVERRGWKVRPSSIARVREQLQGAE